MDYHDYAQTLQQVVVYDHICVIQPCSATMANCSKVMTLFWKIKQTPLVLARSAQWNKYLCSSVYLLSEYCTITGSHSKVSLNNCMHFGERGSLMKINPWSIKKRTNFNEVCKSNPLISQHWSLFPSTSLPEPGKGAIQKGTHRTPKLLLGLMHDFICGLWLFVSK